MSLPTQCDGSRWRKKLLLGLLCALFCASCAGPGLEPPGANDDLNSGSSGRGGDDSGVGTDAEGVSGKGAGGAGGSNPPQASGDGGMLDDDAGVEP